MDRIIAANSVDFAHRATPPGVGTPQYAGDGPPGTVWPAYQYNALQEELLAIVNAAGIAFDRTDLTQILQALRILKGNRQTNTIAVGASPYTLQASDIGKIVRADGLGAPMTFIIPPAIFNGGDEIILFGYSASLLTVQRGAGVELNLTSDAAQLDNDVTIGKGGRGLLWKRDGGSETFAIVDEGQVTAI